MFHRVLVLKGTRIIVAFWTTEAIYQYSKQVLAYFPWKVCQAKRDERVALLKVLRLQTPMLKNKNKEKYKKRNNNTSVFRNKGIDALTKLWSAEDEAEKNSTGRYEFQQVTIDVYIYKNE